MFRLAPVIPALLLLSGCGGTVIEIFEQCTLAVDMSADVGAPGTEITVAGGPWGEAYDNVVQIDGALADVVSTDRTERLDEAGEPRLAGACDKCDACRERNAGHCNRCRIPCYECIDTLIFSVPDSQPGDQQVQFLNAWGGSEKLPFTVLDAPNTPTTTPTGTPTGQGTTAGGTGASR